MWPEIEYFNAGTEKARSAMAQLEFVDRHEWRELYRHKSEGSYWRIDSADKYQERYIVHVPDVANWKEYDSSPLQKSLLYAGRGRESTESCGRMGCAANALNGLAFCVDHAYEQGIRR